MEDSIIREWSEKLGALIIRAEALAQSGSGEDRRALADELQQFIMDRPMVRRSAPGAGESEKMDKIAGEARDALRLSVVEDRVSAIAGRTVELAGLTATVRAQTSANEAAAKAIRLEKARKVVAAVTDSVNAIEALGEQIDGQTLTVEDLAALKLKLAKTVDSLEALKTSIETGG